MLLLQRHAKELFEHNRLPESNKHDQPRLPSAPMSAHYGGLAAITVTIYLKQNSLDFHILIVERFKTPWWRLRRHRISLRATILRRPPFAVNPSGDAVTNKLKPRKSLSTAQGHLQGKTSHLVSSSPTKKGGAKRQEEGMR